MKTRKVVDKMLAEVDNGPLRWVGRTLAVVRYVGRIHREHYHPPMMALLADTKNID